MTSCGLVVRYPYFGGRQFLHLQCRGVTLKTDAVNSSNISVKICLSIWHHISEDVSIHSHRCEHSKNFVFLYWRYLEISCWQVWRHGKSA
jgi:hypothetical protein